MTMIGFVARDDHAEILTDSISYTHDLRRTGMLPHESKVVHLPAVAAAVVIHGSGYFRELWRPMVRKVGVQAADFDAFNRTAEQLLVPMHDNLARLATAYGDGEGAALGAAQRYGAYHIGWSPSAGRFLALAYVAAGDGDVRRFQLDGLTMAPAPLGYRPGPTEALAFRDVWARVNGADTATTDVMRWLSLPVYPEPGSVVDWRELAVTAHRTRSVEISPGPERVPTGGDVHLARLTRDGMTVDKIHEFTDADEFRRMVRGTGHDLDPEREHQGGIASGVEPALELAAA